MLNQRYSMASSSRDFMYKVYGWMAVGLAITAGISYWIASTPALYKPILQSPGIMMGIFIAQFVTILVIGFMRDKLSYAGIVTAFAIYAGLIGVTLSSILLVYTAESVATAFIITSGMFSAMALYGYLTKSDLSGMGSFLMMGLWGVIIAMLVNMWFQSPAMQYYISLAAVGIFTLLTAYDVQNIKRLGESMMVDAETRNKIAVMGALTLYLDFINLFIHLIQLFGKRRDN